VVDLLAKKTSDWWHNELLDTFVYGPGQSARAARTFFAVI